MALVVAEETRVALAPTIDRRHKAALGQFMTPAPVAQFMARMFPAGGARECRLLDAGAGLGALTCAFLDRWRDGGFAFQQVSATAYELDDRLRPHLKAVLAQDAAAGGTFSATVRGGDFVLDTALRLLEGTAERYTHALLNPPYRKIPNHGLHRRALAQVGCETVNLYAAFVWLTIRLLEPGGQLVAIVPRSFCNGTYFRSFREAILRDTAIRAIHLFERRDSTFSDDEVLQENVIVLLEKGARPGDVCVTTSSDERFDDVRTQSHPFARIVIPGDEERFIHVPTSAGSTELERLNGVRFTLADIGVQVSTGPVVDFRLAALLRPELEPGSVPLIYPAHFSGRGGIEWPASAARKPNAIVVNEASRRWLMPPGHYCLVRRFSSKEERRRVVAAVFDPKQVPPSTEWIGFENHLNLFHDRRRGLPSELAWGLATFLNTSAVDEAFRRFSGHTQVNAGDLKTLRYPSRDELLALGDWATRHPAAEPSTIDEAFRAYVR
jgi:tRNA1(Val) A37 N6-methylase TrmN6